MSVSLRAHYLEIEWQECGVARGITVAPEPIEIEELDDGTLLADTQVFNGLCPWVGLRFEVELAGVQPAFEENGSLIPMLQISDVHGGRWWVQNSGWDSLRKRHLSEMHRTMGTFSIVIGSRRLLLNNVVDGLTRVQVEDYLRDFQQDLIWLVMGFGGATSATNNGVVASREMVEALEAFAAASRRVLANPARHVREVSIESRPARLRPNMATFRQYLRNPNAQRFSGRGAEETPDIADNRYLRHMVQVCERLASSLAKSAEQHAKVLADRAKIEAERSAGYQSMTHRRIDPDVYDRQLLDLSERIKKIESFHNAVRSTGIKSSSLEFRVGSSFGYDRVRCLNKDSSRMAGEMDGEEYSYSVLKVPESLLLKLKAAQDVCDYYLIRGNGVARRPKKSSGGVAYRQIDFEEIYSVEVFTDAVARKEERRIRLEEDNWMAPLTSKEKRESQGEAKTAKLRGKVYRDFSEQAEQASSALIKCRTELRSQDLDWQGIGVKSSPEVPMGVRFSQSPNYAACQAAFEKIKKITDCAGLNVEALDSIERIGVLHASALYERWCLVKILSILMEDYAFQPENGWQDRLVMAVSGKPESLGLVLHREDIGMSAYLEVQPELPNGRRPDFRLSFWYPSTDNLPNTLFDDLIMDAKFRTRWKSGDLEVILSSLLVEKKYDQDGDRVFILHPDKNAILHPSSPLSWGRDCDYGQDSGVNHRRGTVYLAPRSDGSSPEDNLRRLIAMQLQSKFPEPTQDEQKGDGFWKGKTFCLRCGKVHRSQDIKREFTRRRNRFWVFSCSECKMEMVRTHCYSCNSTPIFKNGLDITYHKTVADQVTNVVCSNCGSYFDNEMNDQRHGLKSAFGDHSH